jgi:hypothetical protein
MYASIKNLLCACSIVFLMPVFSAFSQKTVSTNLTYVKADAVLKKVYTKEELELLGKLELTQIYQERVAIITEIIPYLALHSQPGATLTQMGIPQTSVNVDHLEKEVKNKQEYITSVNETLVDIIPYADKQNIIWSILFFQDVIQKSDYANNTSPTVTPPADPSGK